MRGALAAAGALPPLVAMLGDGTAEERAAAAEALGKLAHNEANKAAMAAAGAVEALVALVRDGDAQGKANAAGALWYLAFGDVAIKAAMEAIVSGSDDRTINVCWDSGVPRASSKSPLLVPN
jgi:hypothetical protein